MKTHSLVDQVRSHVLDIFKENEDTGFIYHNELHTRQVVRAVEEISRHYSLNDEDRTVLATAAWFHDVGYFTDFACHEKESARLVFYFLRESHESKQFIERVENCILATRTPQKPCNLFEQILCDADLFHLGTEEFANRNELLRQEFELVRDHQISDRDWTRSSLEFLTNHQFHTLFAINLLRSGKEKNISLLNEKMRQYPDSNQPTSST